MRVPEPELRPSTALAAVDEAVRSLARELPSLTGGRSVQYRCAVASGLPKTGATAAAVDVFISARSDDRKPAERVYDFLSRHSLRVFLSQVSLPALGDTDYRKAIDDVLETAAHLVVVTSTGESTRSRWVEHEWGSFLNEKLAGRKTGNLVTVTVGRVPERELPLALRNHQILCLDDDGLDRLLRYVGGRRVSDISTPIERAPAEKHLTMRRRGVAWLVACSLVLLF